jgi:hypothetical protein
MPVFLDQVKTQTQKSKNPKSCVKATKTLVILLSVEQNNQNDKGAATFLDRISKVVKPQNPLKDI